MRRRRWLAAGVAVAAAAGGAGVAAWWRARQEAPALWGLEFPTPEGTPLRLADWRGRPLLLNFWATWCAPCVREMPALDRFAAEQGPRGWAVLGLAVDNPAQVRQFLAKLPVRYPIAIAGFPAVALSKELGNTQGGLPFTVAFDRRGQPVWRHLGETTYDRLVRELAAIAG